MSEYQQKEYPQKDNAGVLFKNDKKETDSLIPKYKGNVLMIDGNSEYWFSAWINTS